MNVAAVFAPKKVYECSGSVAFNCVPKLQFAAATRTRPTDAGRLHRVPPRLREVRRRVQIVPMKMRFACQGGGTQRPSVLFCDWLSDYENLINGTVIVKG